MMPDYYTQLPQIRLTGDSTGLPMEREIPTEVTLDGNDVAKLVECAIRHPAANMRYAVLAAIWSHPECFRQIFQFGLKAPISLPAILEIVAGDNRGSAPSAGDIEAIVSGNPNSREQGEQMSGWSKVTKPIPVPSE